MKKRIPEGLTEEQWEAIIRGLEPHPSTINDYRKVLNLLHSYQDDSFRINTLTKPQAEEYYKYLDEREADGTLSANTVHRYKATLRSIGSRVEAASDIFPGYTNPFMRLVKNEIRKPTSYTEEMFADPQDIQSILSHKDCLKPCEAIILEFMVNLGATPNQVNNLQVCDFITDTNPEKSLCVHVPVGTILEKTREPYDQSDYYRSGMPVKLSRSSMNSITWQYFGTFEFFDSFEGKLHELIPDLGRNKDARPFFRTSRHMNYSYRALHHLVLTACENAGIPRNSVKPYQLSLYGLIRSYLLDENLRRHAEIDRCLAQNPSPGERKKMLEELKSIETVFLPLAKESWIGNWKDRFPLPLQNQIDIIKKQLGEDFLYQAVGLNH